MNLPPVVEIIFERRLFDAQSPGELAELLGRGLFGELRRQARWSLDEWSYDVRFDRSQFLTTPIASLSPFTPFPQPPDAESIAQTASVFARTVALYSDVAVIRDPFTHVFAGHHAHSIEQIFILVKALGDLQPFLKRGTVRFGGLLSHEYIHGEIEQAVANAAARLVRESLPSLTITFADADDKHEILIHGIPVQERGLAFPHRLTVAEAADLASVRADIIPAASVPSLANIVEEEVARLMRLAIDDMSFAATLGATALSGCRTDTDLVSRVSGIALSEDALDDVTRELSVDLPWIANLTPAELLALRDRADFALPRLRQLLANQVGAEAESGRNFLSELRAQATEVEAELQAITNQRNTLYRSSVQGLAIALFGYGVSTGVPAIVVSSVAALLAALAHGQSVARESSAKLSVLRSKPGFALVQAKKLLQKRRTA